MAPIALEDVPSTGTVPTQGFWDGRDADGKRIGGFGRWDESTYPPVEVDVHATLRARGLTLRTFAARLGLSASDASALMRGRKRAVGGWDEVVRRLDEVAP